MKITPKQRQTLETLSCERLSASKDNKILVDTFQNSRNSGLADYLKNLAWEEEIKGSVAYYLIKDEEGELLFFFSLKCGALFEHIDEKMIREQVEVWQTVKKILQGKDPENSKYANLLLEKLRSGSKLSDSEIEIFAKKQCANKKDEINSISEDIVIEDNEHIVRVGSTFSGIELVHFCANEAAREKWRSYGFDKSMGEVLFWHFIVPIFSKVREFIGCQYAFLFAADLSEDGSLINYYKVALHFAQMENIGASKPIYDMCCKFMCQDINSLIEARKDYFDNFNSID